MGLPLLFLLAPHEPVRLPVILIHVPDTYRGAFVRGMERAGVYVDYFKQREAIRPGLDLSRYKLILLYRVVPALRAALKPALEEARSKGAVVVWLPGRRFDPLLADYFSNPSEENFARMLRYLAAKYFGKPFEVEPPIVYPEVALYHPSTGLLPPEDFLARRRPRPGEPVAVVLFHKVYLTTGNMRLVNGMLGALEGRGFFAVATYSEPVDILRRLAGEGVEPDVIVKLRVLRFSFRRPREGAELLKKFDAPLFGPVRVSNTTLGEWRRSKRGLDPLDLTFLVTIPEVDGTIEPLVVGGKTFRGEFHVEAPLPGGLALAAERAWRWARLKRLPNSEKRVAIVYWSVNPHAPGPGAAYLDVPRSLERLLLAMAERGYKVGNVPKAEELALALSSPPKVRIPLRKYLSWLRGLDPQLREALFRKWGRPKGDVWIRALTLGNVVIAPQPPRAEGPDIREAIHSPTLPPPHKYVALYMWLVDEFRADAIVHFGTHGTLEFLPGREAGLSTDDWPVALLGPLPNVYLYNCVNVGEAVTAKRRSLAVIISHNIPKFEEMGLSGPLAALKRLITFYRESSGDLRRAYLRQIIERARKLCLLGEGEHGERAVKRIWDRICEIEEEKSPAGLHILEAHEIRALLHALDGGFIEPSPGGDPLKNPAVLPTGRNLYSIDPRTVPTEAAWEVGVRLAEDLLSRMARRLGRLPRKVGFTLWAGETVRQHGVLEAMLLWLLGVRPVWDKRGYVVGLKLVPQKELGRPRIDVVITTTGVYRDLFPDLILLLHRAVKLAAEAEGPNFVREDTEAIKRALLGRGLSAEEAEKLSTVRIFAQAPGEYGTRLSDAILDAGICDEDELANLYFERMGHAYGEGIWGESARETFEEALKGAEAVVMSRSSKLYGVLDVDEAFQYLGGMGLGISAATGKGPVLFIANLRGEGRLETLPEFMAREVFSRYLNPRWIKAMMRHGRSGALAMLEFVENLWGWRTVAPEVVSKEFLERAREVYLEDSLGVGVREWLERVFPEAWRRMRAILSGKAAEGPSPPPPTRARVRIVPLQAGPPLAPSRLGREPLSRRLVHEAPRAARVVSGIRLEPRPQRASPPPRPHRELPSDGPLVALLFCLLLSFVAGFARGIKVRGA